MKIYTRGGDGGETGLYGGARVRKDAMRVEAYGSLDELNAMIGAVLAALEEEDWGVAEMLSRVQAELFDIGAELATPPERDGTPLAGRLRKVGRDEVEALERGIDAIDARLRPLKTFILPGGVPSAAMLHVARSVARRAERRVISLDAIEPVSTSLLQYLNRLSDLLFVLARAVNQIAGSPERPWKG